MRLLGLDLGTKTLGVSISDTTKTIASFVTTITFREENYEEAIEKLDTYVTDEIEAFVLGLPKNMNNTLGYASDRSYHFKELLEKKYEKRVYMQDERLSTKQAESVMIDFHTSRKKRSKKIDGVAATIILQTYLDKKG